jgi:hypothetical protein
MKFRYGFIILLAGLFLFASCNESTIDEQLFEYTQNYTGSVQVPLNINKITIENSIGFIFLNGSADILTASYVLNKKVKVTESSLAQNEFNKILFKTVAVSDTLNWSIFFPSNLIDRYKCNLNLNIPAGKKIIVKENNMGVQTYALENDIYVETDNDECILEGHGGSAEVHTLTGNITAMISIPDSGYCKCYSSDGNIIVQVPIGSSANIILKTTSGSITHSNLNIQNLAVTNKELTGTIGTGNGTIYVETVKGNILLEGF